MKPHKCFCQWKITEHGQGMTCIICGRPCHCPRPSTDLLRMIAK